VDPRRRRFLAAVGTAASVGLAGCSGLSSSSRKSAQRHVESPTQPAAGTWPSPSYDPANTRYNPSASPPRSTPTTAWSVPLAGVPSAVVVGTEYVYASSDVETVAVTPDGTEQWRIGTGGGLSYVADRLYVTADAVVALDAASGRERWRSSVAETHFGSMYETSGTIYVTGHASVRGLHPDSGTQRWQVETARHPGLVADDRRVGIVTNEQLQFVAPGETESGLLQEPSPHTVETLQPGWRPALQSVILLEETMFVSQYGDRLSDTNAAARRYDLIATDDRWVTPFTWAGVGALAVDDSHVYATPFRATTDPPDGSIVALDRQQGSEQWRYDGAMLGAPAVGGNTVVAGGADPGSPSVCVSSDSDSDENCSPGEPPAESGILHAFDAETGKQLWTITPGASYGGYPLAVVGDRVYYADADGLHALE
jgi:hypothetical protein